MNNQEKSYLDLLTKVLHCGAETDDRTGVGTYKLFGEQLRFNLSLGFPLLTTKKVHFKSVAHELLWFLSGRTDVKYLQDRGVSIWNEWEKEDGTIGPGYSKQWRNFGESGELDQITSLIHEIKTNPQSRRLIVTAWNPIEIPQMALPPCHCFFQFNVINGKLSCQLYQRSADLFLGSPFNIASYALLTHIIANICDLDVGELIYTLGDYHIYKNHIDAVKTQIQRIPNEFPKLLIKRKLLDIDDVSYDDIEVIGYAPQAGIKAPVAV
jgi:thymidylate synthase